MNLPSLLGIAAAGAALVMFAPPPASAFYNPSTGRWLNRDPLGELSFQRTRVALAGGSDRVPLLTPSAGGNVLFGALPHEFAKANAPVTSRELNGVAHFGGQPAAYAFVGADPISGVDCLGLVKVCIRPVRYLRCLHPWVAHCFLDLEDGTTFSYDRHGIHADPDPNNPKKRCADVVPSSITPVLIEFQVFVDKASGLWNGQAGHCCIWVDHVLTAWGSAGVESYFPGYYLPPDF